MSLLSSIAHYAGQPVGWGAEAAGALIPGQTGDRLSGIGSAITNPNVVLSNPGGILQSPVAANGQTAQSNPTFTTVNRPTSTPAGGSPSGTNQSLSPGGNVLGANGFGSDPQASQYYGDQIGRVNAQLGFLDPQLGVGKQNILDAYNSGLNTLNTGEARASRDYNTNRTNTISDQQTAKQNIDTGVRQQTTALQRLLGRAGSGNSSAAYDLAPFAAARAGSQQRQQVQDKYGRNLSALDTNYNDYETDVGNSRNDLGRQRDTQTNALIAGTNQTRAQLLDTLAGLTTQQGQAQGQSYTQARSAAAPYESQINDLLSRVAGLSQQYASPVIAANPTVYNAPSLQSYDYGSTGAPTAPGADQPVYADQVTPYSLLGFGKKQQQGF